MHVHVYAGTGAVIGASDGAWKTLSVQFSGGTIASVSMAHGAPGEISVQTSGSFFQAAELGGAAKTPRTPAAGRRVAAS